MFNSEPLPVREPGRRALSEFTGVVEAVLPDILEVTAFVVSGVISRTVPALKANVGRSLQDFVDWYLRHSESYFVFEAH